MSNNNIISVPTIEEIYDMDLDTLELHNKNLLLLKDKLNDEISNERIINEDDSLDLSYISKLLSFIKYEINERKSSNELIDYFKYMTVEKLISEIEEKIIKESKENTDQDNRQSYNVNGEININNMPLKEIKKILNINKGRSLNMNNKENNKHDNKYKSGNNFYNSPCFILSNSKKRSENFNNKEIINTNHNIKQVSLNTRPKSTMLSKNYKSIITESKCNLNNRNSKIENEYSNKTFALFNKNEIISKQIPIIIQRPKSVMINKKSNSKKKLKIKSNIVNNQLTNYELRKKYSDTILNTVSIDLPKINIKFENPKQRDKNEENVIEKRSLMVNEKIQNGKENVIYINNKIVEDYYEEIENDNEVTNKNIDNIIVDCNDNDFFEKTNNNTTDNSNVNINGNENISNLVSHKKHDHDDKITVDNQIHEDFLEFNLKSPLKNKTYKDSNENLYTFRLNTYSNSEFSKEKELKPFIVFSSYLNNENKEKEIEKSQFESSLILNNKENEKQIQNSKDYINNNITVLNPNQNKYLYKKPLIQSKETIYNKTINTWKKNNQILKLKQKSSILQNPSIQLIDYSKHFPTFLHLFNGYYLSKSSSNKGNLNGKGFDYIGIMKDLLISFKNLIEYEKSNIKLKLDGHVKNIVNCEGVIINNRLKELSNSLLYNQFDDQSYEKIYMHRKIIDLQKIMTYNDNINSNISNFDDNKYNKDQLFYRVIYNRPEIYDIVNYCFGIKSSWRELPHGLQLGNTWNILWTYSYPKINYSSILSIQKVNHYINNRTIARKDLLNKSINRIRAVNEKSYAEFDIIPQTFLLGKEYLDFLDAYMKNGGKENKKNIWIVKPNARSRGKGIFLTNELSEVSPIDGYIVQKYILNPLLIDGVYKFDMRIYALVTSVNPLEAFIYNEGFARISNFPYTLQNLDIKIHLTNAAIQDNSIQQKLNKQKRQVKSTTTFQKTYGGSKISLDMLKRKLSKSNISWNLIWEQVKTIVLKTLISTQLDIQFSPSSFELFGFDVLIDSNLNCLLIEVNMSPSLERSNVLDDQIKLQLIDDIIKLLEVPKINKEGIIEVLERRIKQETMSSTTLSLNNNIYSPIAQLNIDMNRIFNGQLPRRYGENPKEMSKFEKIAPTYDSERLIKISRSENDKFNLKKEWKLRETINY